MLLGMLGSYVATIGLDQYNILIDILTFSIAMFNFAVVGVVSIFYQKGISNTVTQTYLIITSVIFAWQLGNFPEWTTWALLVLLGVYDLCAVLTPCGPLKLLVNLVEKKGAPLPGLLYEADVPSVVNRDDEEVLIMENQRAQYGSTAAASQMPTREGLVSFYKEFNPEKVPHVDSILEAYAERHPSDLWNDLQSRYGAEEARTIKLGLGDFIFYSVLVSRAAMFDTTSMLATLCTILTGLGGTLMLLAVYKKALPALPISIFFATLVYFINRLCFVQMITKIASCLVMI